MNNNLKERAGMIKLLSMLGTLTVRLEVEWDWLRNMSSGRLGTLVSTKINRPEIF